MIDISILIAVVGFALSVGTFFIGRTTAAKASGVADGEMRADVKHIKDSVEKQERKLDRVIENNNDLKTHLEKEISELKGRLNTLEDRVKMLHGGE